MTRSERYEAMTNARAAAVAAIHGIEAALADAERYIGQLKDATAAADALAAEDAAAVDAAEVDEWRALVADQETATATYKAALEAATAKATGAAGAIKPE